MTVTLMMMVFTVTFCVFADFTTGGDGFDGGPWGEITLIGPDCPMMIIMTMMTMTTMMINTIIIMIIMNNDDQHHHHHDHYEHYGV